MSAQPHGGVLVNRLASEAERPALLDRARTLPRVPITARTLSDLELIAMGGFSPLRGFLGSADYHEVVEHMHLANGLAWSIPVTCSATAELADSLREGQTVALVLGAEPVAVLELEERYRYDKQREATQVYRTADEAHPGVQALYQQAEVLLAGPITLLRRPQLAGPLEAYHLDPAKVRKLLAERGWRTVVGFQTRNPVHRAHEYIQKCAMEIFDGLLLHPLVGETKSDDVPADVRMRCYEALIKDYYPADRVLLAINPAAMRYAGPREAIFHALVRKNYGCTHFIVGRDHAGVGNYYGTYDAQRIFEEFADGELGITPLCFENTFYCRRCGGMASTKTCPHPAEARVSLSGTEVRALLQRGELPAVEYTRPEVAQVLSDSMRSAHPNP
ncbi:MAG TPA: sulfate adenylyltransferase [Gemmatimonadales bacterium]